MNQTLNSRLRLLVAKTFRAEQLYASIRNANGAKLSSVAALADIANDVRAKEWQRAHADLRSALNEILNLGTGPQMLPYLLSLREKFRRGLEEDTEAVNRGILELSETAQREEFAHVLKLSVELIRQKARAQAHKAICDELTGILALSGRADDTASIEEIVPPAVEEPEYIPSPKVVPLKRKAV